MAWNKGTYGIRKAFDHKIGINFDTLETGGDMAELLKRWLDQPKRRAFLQGMGSVLDLGGTGNRPQVMIFHARPAGQSVRDAWKVAMGTMTVEAGRKESR